MTHANSQRYDRFGYTRSDGLNFRKALTIISLAFFFERAISMLYGSLFSLLFRLKFAGFDIFVDAFCLFNAYVVVTVESI